MKISREKSIEYLKENYSVKTKSEIVSDLGTSWSYIQKLCCLNGIKREFNESKNFGKYSKLMNLEDLETCYWIGFLLADGHIYKEMNIQMNLSISDSDHILRFKRHIGDFPTYKSENIIRICISDVKLAKYLSDRFNWKSNKTKIPPILNNLSEKQMFSLIIGFIDGDGSISSKSIKVKCDISWKNILQDFYYHLTGDNKEFKITNCGCSIFYISKLETIFQIKELAEKFKLPIMDRKWSKIKRRTLKQDKYEIVKNLLNSGSNFKEIKENTKFGDTLIYRVLKENKKDF
jgi:hypothetical protein